MNEQTSGTPTRIEGILKMTAPLFFGQMHLSDAINDYATLHTALNFELDFSDRCVDLIEEGYELAICIGELSGSSYQAKRLTPLRFVLCASPDYLEKMGTPKSLKGLSAHKFLLYGLQKENTITLVDAQGKTHEVITNAKIKATKGEFLVDMAVKGHGITFIPTFIPTFITYETLVRGELVPVLDHVQTPTLNTYAVYPKNRFLSQRCRYLIDFIIERFGEDLY